MDAEENFYLPYQIVITRIRLVSVCSPSRSVNYPFSGAGMRGSGNDPFHFSETENTITGRFFWERDEIKVNLDIRNVRCLFNSRASGFVALHLLIIQEHMYMRTRCSSPNAPGSAKQATDPECDPARQSKTYRKLPMILHYHEPTPSASTRRIN